MGYLGKGKEGELYIVTFPWRALSNPRSSEESWEIYKLGKQTVRKLEKLPDEVKIHQPIELNKMKPLAKGKPAQRILEALTA